MLLKKLQVALASVCVAKVEMEMRMMTIILLLNHLGPCNFDLINRCGRVRATLPLGIIQKLVATTRLSASIICLIIEA